MMCPNQARRIRNRLNSAWKKDGGVWSVEGA